MNLNEILKEELENGQTPEALLETITTAINNLTAAKEKEEAETKRKKEEIAGQLLDSLQEYFTLCGLNVEKDSLGVDKVIRKLDASVEMTKRIIDRKDPFEKLFKEMHW